MILWIWEVITYVRKLIFDYDYKRNIGFIMFYGLLNVIKLCYRWIKRQQVQFQFRCGCYWLAHLE